MVKIAILCSMPWSRLELSGLNSHIAPPLHLIFSFLVESIMLCSLFSSPSLVLERAKQVQPLPSDESTKEAKASSSNLSLQASLISLNGHGFSDL